MARAKNAASEPATGKAAREYDVHPGVELVRKWITELPQKTGRSLDQWLILIRKQGPANEAERVAWLKGEHGLGTNSAWWLAQRAEGKGAEDSDPKAYLKAATGWVEQMYAGAKAGLRPIHDALLALARRLGPDIRVCPCQTIIPIYRENVIAQIKPSARTRIDFGLALKGVADRIPARLIDTGGLKKNDRITHRFEIARPEQVDDVVQRWLRIAYDLNAPRSE